MSDYSDILRLAAGTLTNTVITGSDTYLVTEFPLQTDRNKVVDWRAFVDDGLRDGDVVQSLNGQGGLYGKFSFDITFASLSPNMINYLYTTILQSRYINDITCTVRHEWLGDITINGFMTLPPNIAEAGTQQSGDSFSNVKLRVNRGVRNTD